MSFSYNVKSELLHCFGEDEHCQIAEISAIINLCGQIVERENKICVKIQTENVIVARKLFTLIKKNFNIECNITVRRNNQLKKNRVYILCVGDNKKRDVVENFLKMCCVRQEAGKYKLGYIDENVFSDVCCKRAYIRGAFLACGSVNDPEKTYHMEFVVSSLECAESLMSAINSFGVDSKYILRKEHYVIYVKEGEQIADILNIIGAHVSLMKFENIRILKDMRNNVNRRVNCETANLSKTINAAVKQIEEIEFIRDNYGLKYLPPMLYQAAEARLKYPDASLKELGGKGTPPVGKSGMNHRLHKISEIAQKLMKGMGKNYD